MLLYVLLPAKRGGFYADDAELLAAAALFHDTRRIDDGFDVGMEDASRVLLGVHMSHSLPFRERPATASWSIATEMTIQRSCPGWGKRKKKGLVLHRIFKDADALDRYRLGPGKGALDERYLRTDAARELMGFAKKTVENWES